MHISSVALALSAALGAHAHMQMSYPFPFRSALDPANAWPAVVDYSMTSPLDASGANYPCKGYIDSTTPIKAVLTAGSPCVDSESNFLTHARRLNVTLTGTATHGGGSCQFSLSCALARSLSGP